MIFLKTSLRISIGTRNPLKQSDLEIHWTLFWSNKVNAITYLVLILFCLSWYLVHKQSDSYELLYTLDIIFSSQLK